MRKGMFLFLAVLLTTVAVHAQKEFDGLRGTHNWPQFSDAPNALYHHIANEIYTGLDARSQKVNAIHTLAEWKQRQQWLKKALQQAIGPFPERTPLNATVVKTYDKDFYRLENIVYESRPGYYVTSTLFLPHGAKKAPAIVYCSGHADNGYRPKGYLNEILNFVKKGFVVFAFDPMGQGERLQYYDEHTHKSRFKWPSYEHSYPGAQLFMTGNTLANYFIWDGIRAVDYLLTRSEVDPGRIGITGRSGGGTQSAYIAAFDDRIKAAAPENYITNLKRLVQAMGPQDAEQNFFYGIERGLDMADILEVRAPKPVLVVTTSQDMFPIQGAIETCSEVAKMYKAFGKPQHFSMVTDDAPHATTLKNREASYVFFQQSLDNPGNPKEEPVTLPADEELQVTKTGQVSTSLNAETAYSLNSKDAVRRMQNLEAARKNMPAYLPGMLQSAKQLSGYRQPQETPAPWFAGQIRRKGYVIQKYLLKGEGNYMIPYIILKPEAPVQKAMLYLNPSGKAADVQEDGDMEWFVKNGVMVVAPDLVGIGEMGPGEFQGDSYVDSVSYNIWFAAMLVHRSIVAIRAGDVVRIANQLKKEGIKEIYGLAKKQMAPVLLHAAAFDKDITKIALIQPYASYRAIVMNKDYNANFLHSTVAGSIGVYDLPDLEASLAPKALLIAGVTGANGELSKEADVVRELSVVKAAYQRTAPDKLQVVDEGTISQLSDELQQWMETGEKKIAQRSPPNVVLVYMDDMGYGDVDSYGGIDYATPNLDRLAAQGMRFTNFYAAQPICTASRAAILTGCYPNRIGIHGALHPNSPIGISDKEETIAEMLKKKGYATAIFGKWHLGDAKKFLPLQHGFDEYVGLPYSNDMWPVRFDGKPADSTEPQKLRVPPLPLIQGNDVLQYIRNLDDQATLTTLYTEKAVDFINRHKQKPFFLYLAHSMVHIPLAVSDKFKGKSKQGLFGDVMMEIDWSVGEVMNALKKNGLENNTVFIFTSDNGPWLRFGDHAGSTGGLREGKGSTWEGGQKEPAIIRWPGVVPAASICNKLSSNIDLLPTIAAITQASLPGNKIDGVNILPLLKGEINSNPRDHLFFYFNKNDLEAVRAGHWKLVLPHAYRSVENELPGENGWPGKMHTSKTELSLYDLRRDPGERYDVKKQYPEVVAQLQELVEAAREDMGDDLTGRPGKNRRPPGHL